LAGIAAAQQKSLEEIALERLSSLVTPKCQARLGSAAAVRNAMLQPPHLAAADVELDSVIASGHLPVGSPDLFE
jgi:hypothetical protein